MAVKTVVISDTHLGNSDSLLNFYRLLTDKASIELKVKYEEPEVWGRLSSYLLSLKDGKKHIKELVLLGDIFELSLAEYSFATLNTRAFLTKINELDIFDSIVYVPGNHDHHIWRQIIEYNVVRGLNGSQCREKKSFSNGILEIPRIRHISENPAVAEPHSLLNVLLGLGTMDEYMKGVTPAIKPLKVVYPNYQILTPQGPAFLHHGHFCESWWTLTSDFLTEIETNVSLENLEIVNSPLTDLVWYAFGQSTLLREISDTIYSELEGGHSDKLRDVLNLILTKYDYYDGGLDDGWCQNFKDKIFRWYVNKFLEEKARAFLSNNNAPPSQMRGEKVFGDSDKSAPMRRYLTDYINPLVRNCAIDSCARPTFIFGHTHLIGHDSSFMAGDCQYDVWNTGGWIVEGGEAQPGVLSIEEDGSIKVVDIFSEAKAFG